MARLKTAVLESPGTLDPSARRALADGRDSAVPSLLAAYADKVRRHAYLVTDEDVEALKRAGFTEDAIFEATGAVALGAALSRLEKGMSVLRASAQ